MGGYGQRYTQEFKDSAIQLAVNSEESNLQIAKDLGISSQTLYSWIQKYKESHNLQSTTSRGSSKNKESLEEENRRLRKELSSVKKDREILKKAAAYFAKETL